MSAVANITKYGGTSAGDYRDSLDITWRVDYGTPPADYFDALIKFQGAGGPNRRARYATAQPVDIYANSFRGQPVGASTSAKVWDWTVSFTAPPPEAPQKADGGGDGSGSGGGYELIPTQWAKEYNVEYIDREYVIDKARNVEALSHGDGKGGARAANTLGPIVNAAGKRPDEPLVDTERLPVLVVMANYANLSDIVTQNTTYLKTTNSDTVQGFAPRTLRYLLTESLGRKVENGSVYWPGVTKILVEQTTDLQIDNVGYEYWDATESDWVRAVDKDGAAMGEPINLKLDGDKGGDNTTTITYRHLDAVAYASLF